MKATIEFDDALYRRLKVEAARRGRTVKQLVAEGVRAVLDKPEQQRAEPAVASEWRPSWFGSLASQAREVSDHSMDAIRRSIAEGRRAEQNAGDE